MSLMDDNRILGDDEDLDAPRPKLDLPADEIARLEAEKRTLLAGRQRTLLPDEVPGPRASRVGRGVDAGYPDQREEQPAPVEERSPRGPVTAESAGSSPAGGAIPRPVVDIRQPYEMTADFQKLCALSTFIHNDAIAKAMTLKQYRQVLRAMLSGR